jgi:8-amino-3,8-dideoxy-alpha-D-manno-octulosonate transaminase
MPGYELIGKEERDAVNEVFDRNGILYRYGFDDLRGRIFKVEEFEKAFAARWSVPHAQAVTSGTAALKVSLRALGVGPGDEVITQSHTFVATVEAILELGASPVITEIDSTLNMDPRDLGEKITPRTRAIIPVHMLGSPARMAEIMALAEKHGIPVVEDVAQAPGGEYRGRMLGTFGAAGCFSFDFGKVITTGEGGMVITGSGPLYLKAREYVDHGHEYNPAVPRGEDTRTGWGFNFKMMELQGAIGLAQLGKLDHALRLQRENKRRIKEAVSAVPGIAFREMADPAGDIGDTLVFFLDRPEEAAACARLLRERGFGTKNLPDAVRWHYAGTWDHMLGGVPRYRGRNLMREWPVSSDLIHRAVAVPIFIRMTDDQISRLTAALTDAIRGATRGGP